MRTSPSGEKLKADIAVANFVFDEPSRKCGRPRGPLASKILIFDTLQTNREYDININIKNEK